jgi:hypothetical protein
MGPFNALAFFLPLGLVGAMVGWIFLYTYKIEHRPDSPEIAELKAAMAQADVIGYWARLEDGQ